MTDLGSTAFISMHGRTEETARLLVYLPEITHASTDGLTRKNYSFNKAVMTMLLQEFIERGNC